MNTHVSLWDVREVLPLVNRDLEFFPMGGCLWLNTTNACNGGLQRAAECAIPPEILPTCSVCKSLWETVLVMRDARLERATS